MQKVIIIGCPGSGKSTFARRLKTKTALPLFYLDMIWHKPDKTNISEDEFNSKLQDILSQNQWIIDGNYQKTLKTRIEKCDTIFLLDFPLKTCIEGAKSRIGQKREDMPGSKANLIKTLSNLSLIFTKTNCLKYMSY